MDAAQGRIDLLRHLEYFVAIADEGHFGRAAETVGISQPPLSQGLRRLERRLGSALFVRDGRGVALTAAGRALLPHARRVLGDAEALLSAAARVRDAPAAVRIGACPQLPLSLVTGMFAAARRVLAGDGTDARPAAGPGAGVAQTIAPTATLLTDVAGGRLDVAVVVHPAPVAGLLAGPVVRLPGRVLIAADHPLARSASGPALTLRELARALPLALPPREHHPAAHDHLLDTTARWGVRLSARRPDDDRAAMLAAASGAVAALTADPALASADVCNLALDGDPLPLRVRLVRPADPDGRATEGLLAALAAALEPEGKS